MEPRPEDVDLLVGLVRIPSVSTHEGAAVEYLVGAMSARGFRARIDDAGNAVGEIGEGSVHVALVGHIDTVPGEISVRVEDGALIGRGAVDAKGPLAAFVAAATNAPAGVRVTVVGAVEEEHPTSKGARAVARRPAPDHCVIGEPSGWDGITVGYKGRLVLRFRLAREARHGAHAGTSVAEDALALWQRVRAYAASRASEDSAFGRLDCRLDGIRAGDSDGITERAELTVGYRLPPGIDPDDLARQVQALAPDVEVVSKEEPVRASRATTLARAFQRAIREAGGTPSFKVKTGTSDMNVLARAWRCPIVAYGPGDARYDHTPMERLGLTEFARGIDVLRRVLHELARI